jgi:hypothetical protein
MAKLFISTVRQLDGYHQEAFQYAKCHGMTHPSVLTSKIKLLILRLLQHVNLSIITISILFMSYQLGGQLLTFTMFSVTNIGPSAIVYVIINR